MGENDYIEPEDFGLVESPPDPNDWTLNNVLAGTIDLPTHYYTGPWPVNNQFNDPSTYSMCVGYSNATGRTVGEKKAENLSVIFDPIDLYDQCKKIDGTPAGTPGTYIRAAMQVMKDKGALAKTVNGSVPYERTRMPIAAYVALDPHNLTDIKTAIKSFGASVIGIKWYKNWNRSGGMGGRAIFPRPGTYATKHAIIATGWDDSKATWAANPGALKLQNSGGKAWGVNGEAWLPYKLIGTEVFEAWQTVDEIEDNVYASQHPEAKPVELINYQVRRVADVPAGTTLYHLDGSLFKKTANKWSGRAVIAASSDGKYFAMPTALDTVRRIILVEQSAVRNVHFL